MLDSCYLGVNVTRGHRTANAILVSNRKKKHSPDTANSTKGLLSLGKKCLDSSCHGMLLFKGIVNFFHPRCPLHKPPLSRMVHWDCQVAFIRKHDQLFQKGLTFFPLPSSSWMKIISFLVKKKKKISSQCANMASFQSICLMKASR